MKIAYNPLSSLALTAAPAGNDITFDLPGINIYVRGVRFKGTDTTYNVFKKHTSSGSGGYNGLVPVPSHTTTSVRYLREDGTWQVPIPQVISSTYTQLSNEDFNSLREEGRWYFIPGSSTTTNGPTGVNNGAELYIGRNASGYRYQKVITAPGIVWFRYWTSTSWSSWVRWYTDANTDKSVLQAVSTTANFRPLIIGYTNSSDPAVLTSTVTNQVYTANALYAQPSTGTLFARIFNGNLRGNADTSTSLGNMNVGNAALPVYFASGKPIACTASSLFSGLTNDASQISITIAGQNRKLTVDYASNAGTLGGRAETSFFRTRGTYGSIASNIPTTAELSTSNGLNGSWIVQFTGASGHLMQFSAGGGSTRYVQLYSHYSGSLYWRNSTDSTLNTKSWKTIVDSANYTGIVLKIGTATKGSATLPIYLNAGTPTACSTTLGVSITGNAATATKLQTARTINGTSFNGTTNITTAYWGVARTITLSGAVTGSASVNGSQNVTITTTYQTGSIDGRYVGGKKEAGHGAQGTAYTADTYSSNFVNKAFVAYAERGSWDYANNGYITTDTGVNIPLAGTAVFQWGARDTNKTQLFITPHNNSGVSNPAANEMLFYTSNGSGYTSAWTRVLTHRNYTAYTVTKTGGGASGTWGISITGSAPWANITGKPGLLTLAGITSLTNKDLNYARYNFGTTNKGDDSTQLNVPANYGLYLSLAYSDKNQGGQIFFNTVPGTTGTLYFRTRNAGDGNTVNTWKSWKTVLDSTNYTAYFNPANYVTALGTSGNYLTWTKNGSVNNITIPYSTRSGYLYPISSSPDNSRGTGYGARVFYSWNIGRANNATAGYSNGITIGANPGDTAYGFQIVQNMWDDRTYTRRYNSGWQSWKTLAWTTDIKDPANYYWANIRISASSNAGTSPTFSTAYTSNWFRSTGSTGWYSQTYGGGWYMSDSTWIRTYGSKSVYQNTGQIRTDGYLVTNGGLTAGATSPNNGTYKLHVTGASWSSGLIRAGGGFYHNSVNSNSYVLLAGGGYKAVSDFATSGHTHSYLPLSGGTMTGGITFPSNARIDSNGIYNFNELNVFNIISNRITVNTRVYSDATNPIDMSMIPQSSVVCANSSKSITVVLPRTAKAGHIVVITFLAGCKGYISASTSALINNQILIPATAGTYILMYVEVSSTDKRWVFISHP